MNTPKNYNLSLRSLLCFATAFVGLAAITIAQDDLDDEEIFEMSPFRVDGSNDNGYAALCCSRYSQHHLIKPFCMGY